MPPSGDFTHFPVLLVQKGHMYSNLPRDRMHFHQLGACERECFRLAGILIAEGDLKQELLGTLATGKYPILFRLDRVVFQVPVIQAPALGTQYSEWAGGIAWLLNLVMSGQSVAFLCRSSGSARLRGFLLSRTRLS